VKTYSLLEYTFLTFIFSELSEVSRTKNVDTFYIKDSITDISDVNSDNASDIVVASYGSTSVSVLVNAGNGTFLSQTTYSTGSSPHSVAVVDLNSDNKPDIVVTSYGTSSVDVLLNAGNGTFLSQTPYVAGSNPRSVSVADVNSDNQPDIIVANASSNNVGVLLHY
jgi:hypothetical protein